jgi:hypothetical protein
VLDANDFRASLWTQRGVEIVDVPDHGSVLPFLMRLRYESYGQRSGDLWQDGSRRGHVAVDPWRSDRQLTATHVLNGAKEALIREFAIRDRSEVVEIGIFLIRPDGNSIELCFRSGLPGQTRPDGRVFSIDPTQPSGVAGRVVVSGDVVRVPRSDPLHNYGMTAPANQPAGLYEGIACAPVIDWTGGGIPLGAIYVTTATVDGAIFSLPTPSAASGSERTLADLANWLADLAITLISSWR